MQKTSLWSLTKSGLGVSYPSIRQGTCIKTVICAKGFKLLFLGLKLYVSQQIFNDAKLFSHCSCCADWCHLVTVLHLTINHEVQKTFLGLRILLSPQMPIEQFSKIFLLLTITHRFFFVVVFFFWKHIWSIRPTVQLLRILIGEASDPDVRELVPPPPFILVQCRFQCTDVEILLHPPPPSHRSNHSQEVPVCHVSG